MNGASPGWPEHGPSLVPWVRLWPPVASEQASTVDAIFIALLVFCGAIFVLVLGLLVVFSIRYRRGSKAKRGDLPAVLRRDIEIGWYAAVTFLAVFMFGWAGATQLALDVPPPGALEIHVVAKQWMWKAEHPNGAREINELHLPSGEAVRLVMTSQDVIHSFFVPAFRRKQDVLPGRFTELWFRPTEEGEFHLFCAEFCGTSHSRMVGRILVMAPEQYAAWVAAQPQGDTLARQGESLFNAYGCSGCHALASAVHAPRLAALYGRPVQLSDGRVVRADEAYIRDSILQPRRDVVAGYEPIMPSFSGLLDEGELQRIIAYIRSLRPEEAR
jgi:cytochrome c oxidase subunit II